MSLKKKAYTMNWSALINSYNKNNVGQLTQKRLADVFGQSTAIISLDQTIPRTLKNLEDKYLSTHIKHFESTIPFKNLLIEHKVVDKKV